MSRHKKFVKSEKAKTKLKGAKLEKGLNITKTDFKIKKIVIREQIRDTTIIEDGAVVRSQNIKELLTKLHHHNATSRNEGVRYLKELVTNHPQEASKHLGAIIQGICQLALDIEKDVRRECYKALNLVFATQTSSLILPFFNVITSFLRCAMTHINMQIQEDSLYMLDCLLLYTPSLVAANSDSIFSSFLDMISKLRIESKPERTLTINLGSKLTSVKWRSKVLERLLGILRAIVDNRKNEHKQQDMVHDQNPSNGDIDDAFKLPEQNIVVRSAHHQINQIFNPDKDGYYSIRRVNLNQNCELPFLFRKTVGPTSATNLMNDRDEGQRIRKYAELLMPLLFETWMEVRPAKLNNKQSIDVDDEDVQISNEAAFTLKTIVDIVEQMLELIQMWDNEVNNNDLTIWFRNKYGQEFCSQFLFGFPYLQGDGFKGSKRKSKGSATEQEVYEAGGQRCHQQNLNISYVFCCLNTTLVKCNQHWAEKIIDFLKNNISHLDAKNQEISNILMKLLRAILIENAENWIKTANAVNELLALVLGNYHHGKFAKEIRTKVLILLCDIVLNRALYTLYGNDLFSSWLSTLPKMLCQPHISMHVLRTFSYLAKQQNPIFLQHLQEESYHIMRNLSKIQIIGVDSEADGKQSIVNLFFWLKAWKPDFNDESKNYLVNEWPLIEQLIQIRNLL